MTTSSKINEQDFNPENNFAKETTLEEVKSDVASVKNDVSGVKTDVSNVNTNVNSVKSSIGATGDTGGSTTAGSLFAKLNALLTNWTSTRAGYIDTIKTNTERLTSARATKIDNIGATSDTGGTASAGTVMGKLNALVTNTTANNTASTTGTLSQKISSAIANTATNNTASKTGVLSAKLAYVISLLENSTHGLSAIRTKLNNGVTASVGTIKDYIEPVYYSGSNLYAYFYKKYVSGSNTIASGTVLWSLSNVFVYPNILSADKTQTTGLKFVFTYGTGNFQITIDEYTKTVELNTYDYTYVTILLPAGMKISKIELKAISKVTMIENNVLYIQRNDDGLGLAQL